jgi:hypothetical protein
VAKALKTAVPGFFMQQIECSCDRVLARMLTPFSGSVNLSGQRLHPDCGVPLSLGDYITDHRLNKTYPGWSTAWVVSAICILSNSPFSHEFAR